VYNVLDEDVFPRPASSSVPRRPVSGVEKLLRLQPKTVSLSLLPHSPVVSDTLSILQEESAGLEAKDWVVPTNTLRSIIPSRSYQVHSPAFPLKPPTLDKNASKVGLSNTPRLQLSTKLIESWEARARTLATVASHADLFASASFALLQEETFSPVALRRLLEASGRAARHSAALAISSACEMLHVRRDSILETGKVLTSASKDTLRSAL